MNCLKKFVYSTEKDRMNNKKYGMIICVKRKTDMIFIYTNRYVYTSFKNVEGCTQKE